MLRPANKSDIPAMVELGAMHVASCSYKDFAYDRAKTAKALSDLMDKHGFAVVAEQDGKIVGGMVGDVVEMWFSTTRLGIEHIIFIHPKYRGPRMAVRLIAAWEKWCKIQKCEYIQASVTSGHFGAANLYARLGFEYVGPNFRKRID